MSQPFVQTQAKALRCADIKSASLLDPCRTNFDKSPFEAHTLESRSIICFNKSKVSAPHGLSGRAVSCMHKEHEPF